MESQVWRMLRSSTGTFFLQNRCRDISNRQTASGIGQQEESPVTSIKCFLCVGSYGFWMPQQIVLMNHI